MKENYLCRPKNNNNNNKLFIIIIIIIKQTVNVIQKELEKNNSFSWQIPFFILFIVVVSAGGYMFSIYRKITKTHLL